MFYKVLRRINSFRPYHSSNIGEFFQNKPELGNTFIEDKYLLEALKIILPNEVFSDIYPNLESFGFRASTEIDRLGNECEDFPPILQNYDSWGQRIDRIWTCDAWKQMKAISAEEGLISIAYEKKHHNWSRIHQMVKLYLFSPSSGLYSCPLAMTDGAAKIFENSQDATCLNAFNRLTSRDPSKFWTSGQWMTERKGGSDVARGTDTRAYLTSGDKYRLYGYKWFSSATDSNMALTLARIVDDHGVVVDGTKGISLFYLETRKSDGALNNIQVEKLKNKLGTRQLPTAELLLDGTHAQRISDVGRGIAGISTMLTITRIHNSISAVSNMRRILMLAANYSKKRECFGQPISFYQLHVQTLARMEIETRGSLLLILNLMKWLGLEDCQIISDQQALMLRLMTPIAKLFTAKQCIAVVSEGLESFGGQGFIEDTGLPKYLRDSQVLPIWEGTTNILSLDVLRCIAKTNGEVLKAFESDLNERLENVNTSSRLNKLSSFIMSEWYETIQFIQNNKSNLEHASRDLAFSLARIYIGALLSEKCLINSSEADILTAERWCSRDLSLVKAKGKNMEYDKDSCNFEREIVYGVGN